MRPLLIIAWIFGFTSTAQAAKLFQVIKPHNPQNIVQVDILMNNTSPGAADFCRLKNISQLDFYYLMGGVTEQRSQIEGSIRARFKQGRPKPTNKALCAPTQPAGQTCSAIYVQMDEISWVNHPIADPTLVIKAASSGGRCAVGAFIDTGNDIVVIDRVIAKGAREGVHIMPPAATVRIDSVAIRGKDGKIQGPWGCAANCRRKIYLDGREEIVR